MQFYYVSDIILSQCDSDGISNVAYFVGYFIFNYVDKMNIYVGNLSYGTTDKELEEIFGAFGTVTSAKVITDKYTSRSKGFGFVEMEDKAAGEDAIKDLDGKDVGGRNLKVNEARPREDRPRRPQY